MRPQDIEKIAEGIVSSLSRSQCKETVAGCGGFSDPQQYNCPDYSCSSDYECGGAAGFGCTPSFDCNQGFFCACIYSY